ncbi:MAG TPA: hypothetical protein VLS90_03195 [Thermodesulfobacteriota bacterium]|nr:hypothetical protein [Thermodesulfobacteriota bacterium]
MKSLLLEPFRIGKMELKNRMVMAPMGTKHAGKGGRVNEPIKDYFEARARGGVALIIVEARLVDPPGRGYENLLEIVEDSFIPGLSELAMGMKSEKQVAEGVRGVPCAQIIGDSVEPRNLGDPILEGYAAGLKI